MTVLDRNRLDAALRELIDNAEWHHHETAFDLTKNGKYMYLTFAWQAYFFDDIEPQSILVPEIAWAEFVASIRELSNGRLRFTGLSQVISSTVHKLLEYPNPLSERALQECIERIHEVLEWHLHKQTVVVVPLYNLREAGVSACHTSMPLANAVLHFQSSSELKGEVLGGSESNKDVKKLWDCCVLKVSVSGDRQNQRAVALQESSEALKVLRFVMGWTVAEFKQPPYFNTASLVSVWSSNAQILVFYDPDADNRVLMTGCYAHDTATINSFDVDHAIHWGGLDDINFHYANAGHPISDQIIRALTYYDNGTLAESNWEALHNYVVSINVATLSGQKNKQKLRKDIETIIRHGGYSRSSYLDAQLSRIRGMNWEERIANKAIRVEHLYRIRSILTHGGEFNVSSVSETDLLEARELAHNAVRLIAKFARKYQWRDHAEAKDWFESMRQ